MQTTTTRAFYDLRDLMDEHLTTSNLVTRETGRSMRESIELRLERESEGTVVALSEVCQTIPEQKEDVGYGAIQKYFYGRRLGKNLVKIAVLASRPDGSWRLLGSLNPYLNEVRQFVMQQKAVTAGDLPDDLLDKPAN